MNLSKHHRPCNRLDLKLAPTKSLKKRKLRKFTPLKPPFVIKSLHDLLRVAWCYDGSDFSWFRLWKLIPALTELSQMVGMEGLKQTIVDIVLYHIRNKPSDKPDDGDMMHIAIMGEPGTGKTTVAKIIAKIYSGLGYLKTDNVVIAKRSDFIGKWIGHTEDKTMAILESAKDGASG